LGATGATTADALDACNGHGAAPSQRVAARPTNDDAEW